MLFAIQNLSLLVQPHIVVCDVTVHVPFKTMSHNDQRHGALIVEL